MKTPLFNSNLEITLRILLTLYNSDKPIDIERILISDFFTIYAKDYNLGSVNLHGNIQYKTLELTARRNQISSALKYATFEKYINCIADTHGFTYSISPNGVSICKDMMNDLYATKYIKINQDVHIFMKGKSTVELLNIINSSTY